MKKKIVHQSFKLTPHKSRLSIPLVIAGIIASCLAVGVYFYSTMEKTSINMIAESNYPKQMPPVELTAPRDCEKVNSFSVTNNCNPSSYQVSSFTCGINGSVRKSPNNPVCKSYTAWYAEAQKTCLDSCPKATATPVPSNCTYQQVKCFKAPCPKILVCATPRPTATPTPIPSPTACALVTGSCYNKFRTCVQFNDSCQRSSLCASPYVACGAIPSTVPKESTRPTSMPYPSISSTKVPVPTIFPSPTP